MVWLCGPWVNLNQLWMILVKTLKIMGGQILGYNRDYVLLLDQNITLWISLWSFHSSIRTSPSPKTSFWTVCCTAMAQSYIRLPQHSKLLLIQSTPAVVPQNFPSHLSNFSHKISLTQDWIRVWSAQDISSCIDNPKLGFGIAHIFLDYQCFIWISSISMDP